MHGVSKMNAAPPWYVFSCRFPLATGFCWVMLSSSVVTSNKYLFKEVTAPPYATLRAGVYGFPLTENPKTFIIWFIAEQSSLGCFSAFFCFVSKMGEWPILKGFSMHFIDWPWTQKFLFQLTYKGNEKGVVLMLSAWWLWLSYLSDLMHPVKRSFWNTLRFLPVHSWWITHLWDLIPWRCVGGFLCLM